MLIASYHGLYKEADFQLRLEEFKELYVRALFSTERDGMGLRDNDPVHLIAFISSMTATMRNLAKTFPWWICVNGRGEVIEVKQDCSLPTSQQVT